jgi:hypothetical protein
MKEGTGFRCVHILRVHVTLVRKSFTFIDQMSINVSVKTLYQEAGKSEYS